MIGAHVGSGVSSADKVRALEEAIQSETFSRSGRLKSLLRFLCEAEIQGRESDLNEYTIGTMALGRPQEFSPLEDSSVRSRAHELRQRLEKYYTSEAPTAPVRIELRKGSYVPRFSPVRCEEEVAVLPLVLPEAGELTALPAEALTPGSETLHTVRPGPPEIPAIGRPGPLAATRIAVTRIAVTRIAATWIAATWIKVMWIAAAAFAGGAAAMFATLAVWSLFTSPGIRLPATHLETTTGATVWTPELESFWKPFFAQGTPLLIAFETRFFVKMGPLMVRDWRVNGLDHVQDSEALMRVQRLFEVRRAGNRDYADGGTPQALFHLTRLLTTRIPNMTPKNALDITAADLRDNNIILLGKPGMDPEISRFLARGDLVDVGGRILNVHPAPGEQAEYADQSDPGNPDIWGQKYSVITMMPGSAPNRRILTLTASGSEQPSALAYYVTNAETVKDLMRHLHGSAASDCFQVLVRAEYKTKAVVKVEYVLHRTLKVR